MNPRASEGSWRVLSAATPMSHVLGTAPGAASPLVFSVGWDTNQPVFSKCSRLSKQPTPRGALKKVQTLRGINVRLGIFYITNATATCLATPFPVECCNDPQTASGTIYGGARGNLFWILHQQRSLASLPDFVAAFFFSSLASPWCDRRFTFHILGNLLLSLQRYYTETGNEKHYLPTSIVARMQKRERNEWPWPEQLCHRGTSV